MGADVGTGTTLTFGTSGFTANLLSVDGPGMTRESFQTSHMGTTTWHEHIPGNLSDGGEVTVEYQFEGDDVYPTLIGAVAEVITINVAGDGAGKIYSFSGFATATTPAIPLEDIMTASVTLKAAGAVSIT